MADKPSRAGQTGNYLSSPYDITYNYGDSNAGIVRGDGADWFGPLNPLRPIAPPEVAGRQWDFRPGFNLSTIRRQETPDIFFILRQFADTCDIVRLLIETRKDQICRMKWAIALRDEAPAGDEDAAKIKTITKFLRCPDGIHPWNDWMRMLLEDLFVVDAPTIYCQRNAGGQLIGLMPLDGTTIIPRIDDWGRMPIPYTIDGNVISPVAFQQILKGLPAVDYYAQYTPGGHDILYRPRNVRSKTPYGMSPVEQIFTTVNITLRRQLFLLNYYTEGNVPDVLIGCPEDWTPDQIKSYQLYFDDYLSGNLEARRKAKFVPGSIAKAIFETKQPELTGQFDEWLTRLACYAFSIPPNAFTRMMSNRSGAETQKEQAEEEGNEAVLSWGKNLIDLILAREFDASEYEFVWQPDNPVNEVEQETVVSGYVTKGIITINEGRNKLGLDDSDDPAAGTNMVLGATGYVPIGANTIEGKQANMEVFGTPDGSLPPPAPTMAPDGQQSGGQETEKFAKRDVSDEARDSSGRWTSVGDSGADVEDARERQKAKARERAAASRARAKQRAKEADRAKERAETGVTTPAHVAGQSPEEEQAEFKSVIKTAIQGTVLIAGAALVAALVPEVAIPIGVARLTTAAAYIGDGMLASAIETSAVHILSRLGFEAKHAGEILTAFMQHVRKTAGAAGDIQGVNELKRQLPRAIDIAVEMALDYVTDHAPDATLAQHNAIANALEDKSEEFKDKIAAMEPGDLGGAAKMIKAGGRPASPVPFDRQAIREARAAIKAKMTEVLAKVGKKAAAHVRARLEALGKAEDSPEDIAARADLSDFEESVPDIGDELSGVASDSAFRTLVQLGVDDRADLVNQVNEGAVAIARDRAAEMVGMRWQDGELVQSRNAANTITETTRNMLRETIASGLEANLGHDVIADNIADSTAFSPERAELIAHTEVGNINSAASLDSAQTAADAGVEVLKGWLTAGDDKVEDICRGNAAAGFISLDDDFPSGDSAPLAHPHCRCVVQYQVKEENA